VESHADRPLELLDDRERVVMPSDNLHPKEAMRRGSKHRQGEDAGEERRHRRYRD
jgi:hypothetical protein